MKLNMHKTKNFLFFPIVYIHTGIHFQIPVLLFLSLLVALALSESFSFKFSKSF